MNASPANWIRYSHDPPCIYSYLISPASMCSHVGLGKHHRPISYHLVATVDNFLSSLCIGFPCELFVYYFEISNFRTQLLESMMLTKSTNGSAFRVATNDHRYLVFFLSSLCLLSKTFHLDSSEECC